LHTVSGMRPFDLTHFSLLALLVMGIAFSGRAFAVFDPLHPTDLYARLGIERGASIDEVKRAYRELSKKYHPDKSPGTEKEMKMISEAYEVLSEKTKKNIYDQVGSQDTPREASSLKKVIEALHNPEKFFGSIDDVKENNILDALWIGRTYFREDPSFHKALARLFMKGEEFWSGLAIALGHRDIPGYAYGAGDEGYFYRDYRNRLEPVRDEVRKEVNQTFLELLPHGKEVIDAIVGGDMRIRAIIPRELPPGAMLEDDFSQYDKIWLTRIQQEALLKLARKNKRVADYLVEKLPRLSPDSRFVSEVLSVFRELTSGNRSSSQAVGAIELADANLVKQVASDSYLRYRLQDAVARGEALDRKDFPVTHPSAKELLSKVDSYRENPSNFLISDQSLQRLLEEHNIARIAVHEFPELIYRARRDLDNFPRTLVQRLMTEQKAGKADPMLELIVLEQLRSPQIFSSLAQEELDFVKRRVGEILNDLNFAWRGARHAGAFELWRGVRNDLARFGQALDLAEKHALQTPLILHGLGEAAYLEAMDSKKPGFSAMSEDHGMYQMLYSLKEQLERTATAAMNSLSSESMAPQIEELLRKYGRPWNDYYKTLLTKGSSDKKNVEAVLHALDYSDFWFNEEAKLKYPYVNNEEKAERLKQSIRFLEEHSAETRDPELKIKIKKTLAALKKNPRAAREIKKHELESSVRETSRNVSVFRPLFDCARTLGLMGKKSNETELEKTR
jgi:hypothetical protein